MNIRSVVGAPMTAMVFLFLSIYPASAIARLLPSGWELLGIPVGIAIAFGFVHVHGASEGTLGDAGAYLVWVYTVAILLLIADQLAHAAFGTPRFVRWDAKPLANITFDVVVYASAWWLVYEDGWARIRPLNWGADRQDSPEG